MKKCLICLVKYNSVDWECPVCKNAPEFIDGYPTFPSESVTPKNGFKAEYFTLLARLEAKNFWFCSRNNLILEEIKRFFSKANNFFEIGCGTGFVLSEIEKVFPSFSLYGSDIFTEGLDFAKQRLQKVTLLQMDAQRIPFEEEFDVIGAFDVLEHAKNDDLVLSQMHQALRQGGGIILTVPQHNFLWSRFDEACCHLRRYNTAELIAKVKSAGFEIVKTTSFISLLFPFMLLSRLTDRGAGHFSVGESLNFNQFVNYLFGKILVFERILIRLGVSFPFGGSLLLIAYKT